MTLDESLVLFGLCFLLPKEAFKGLLGQESRLDTDQVKPDSVELRSAPGTAPSSPGN